MLYSTTTYDGRRLGLFVLLLLSLPDDLRLHSLPFKDSVPGADFSTGDLAQILELTDHEADQSRFDSIYISVESPHFSSPFPHKFL